MRSGRLAGRFGGRCRYAWEPVTSTLSHRHVLWVGFPSGDMHGRYGKWTLVYTRFWRWPEQSVWDALVQTLLDFALTAPI